jgi:hypothetical protein
LDSKSDSRRQIGIGPPRRQFRLISTMRRKIGDDKARAGGSEELDPAINEISVALARDAARREHRFAAQSASEEGAKPKRKQFGSHRPSASNVPEPGTGEVLEMKIPGKQATSIEPTAIDVAGSMFVASAELVLSTLEELQFHVAAARTKDEAEDILAEQIMRWREAVIQFRAERSRKLAGGREADAGQGRRSGG